MKPLPSSDDERPTRTRERRSPVGLERGVVRLAPHNTAWADRFQEERARLAAALGAHALDIQHVGSTAVHGLHAKAILCPTKRGDAVAVESFEAAQATVAPLETLGYTYRGENGVPRPHASWGHYFVLRTPDGETTLVHVHMLELQSAEWENHLLVRDYLRAHPDAVAAYQALKVRLVEQYRHDRLAYTEGKAAFIGQILERAHLERPHCPVPKSVLH
jgi:GrpB-like predicted nucleotidyltransferase (UPF0157 family)